MKIQTSLSTFAICALLVACSAKTEEQAATQPDVKANTSQTSEAKDLLTLEQMDALRRSRTVSIVFTPAAGSGGNGEVMKELRAINGPLRQPNLNYDVYDPQGSLSTKEMKQQIEISLDRNRRVLIDNGGTPESRAKAAELVTAVVGGSIADTAGTIILRGPEDKKSSYLTIPLFSKADVAAQVAKGSIPNAAEQNNSIENFFFEPQSK
jgi:hypothetical protein